MKKEEFNLSDFKQVMRISGKDVIVYWEEDVKEFIKKLKEELCSCKLSCIDYDDYSCEEVRKIDKLAGDDLKWKYQTNLHKK